jgi:hypothetical protein
MVRRPIFVLSMLLLSAAVVQAAIVTLTGGVAYSSTGNVCTTCGPIDVTPPAVAPPSN